MKHILPLTLAMTASAHAAVLVDWNLDTITGPNENNAEFTGVPNTTATVGAGLSVSDLVTQGVPVTVVDPGLVWSEGSYSTNELNLQRWDRPVDGDGNSFGTGNGVPDNWLEFSLTADPGQTFTLDTMTISAWRNGGGAPSDWLFQTSTDNGLNWSDFGTLHEESNAGDDTFREIDFSDGFSGDDVRIRFIATGPDGGSGNVHINGMSVEGSVVPEPATVTLGALGMLALLRRKR